MCSLHGPFPKSMPPNGYIKYPPLCEYTLVLPKRMRVLEYMEGTRMLQVIATGAMEPWRGIVNFVMKVYPTTHSYFGSCVAFPKVISHMIQNVHLDSERNALIW